MTTTDLTAQDIEIAVAQHFDARRNVVVPNVHWGWDLRYEADLVVLRPSGYCVEVEIKTTASDIRADARKRHQHDSWRFKELWFAVPLCLAGNADIPRRAGVLAVGVNAYGGLCCTAVRRGKLNPDAKPITDKQARKLMQLGVMRIWTLKEVLRRQRLGRQLERRNNGGADEPGGGT